MRDADRAQPVGSGRRGLAQEQAAGTAPSTTGDDLALLRAHEPVVRFTKGELFFPTAVAPYVGQCSLWRGEAGGVQVCVVPAGELSLEHLCEVARAHPEWELSLRFVRQALRRGRYRQWKREPRERFEASLRFTTTGMFGRVAEAGFRASLLARGTVARGVAAAAEIAYREHLEHDRFTYYGRVVRVGGYVCLQYWFFYAMNDWRSTFSGVNDHEADWEMVTVYLAERLKGAPEPAWVAFSSHDHHGDELRRRWDDPELDRLGDHPVLYPGAGSHSGAFVPGDYVVSVNPPQLQKPMAVVRRGQRLLAPWREETRAHEGFGIPFVDYCRGDGRSVGPDQPEPWQAILIDDHTPWVRDYRGLWGLDTEDHFGGERAPAGPRYERQQSVRVAWSDPLGWTGLLKVPPTSEELGPLLRERVAMLEHEVSQREQAVAAKLSELRRVAVEVRSLEAHGREHALAQSRREEMVALEAGLEEEIAARANAADELEIHLDTLRRPPLSDDPQAHLDYTPGPRTEEQQRRTRFLRLWATVSTPLLLAVVPVILLARPLAVITSIAVFAYAFMAAEAFARRRLVSFLASTLLTAAIVAVVLFLVDVVPQHWKIGVSALFIAAALALLAGNLGDLRRGWRRGGEITPPPPGETPESPDPQ
ncbi:MAG: hypothetical protein J2O47_00615 [Acidimicrobiaceae bacterium]|nr:hypothetical protein [Acidimicrobiaceae bacterium]